MSPPASLGPQPAGIPLPRPTAVSRPFWDGCARGELLFQRCAGCATPNFLPAGACRVCQSDELVWERSAGRGTVYSWTTVWRPQTPAFEVPYTVVIVELDEGYRMMSNLVGCPPDAAEVGQRVEVEFHRIDDAITLPYFRPAA